MSDLREALDHTLDAIALNREQAKRLYNPDPQVNSLAERVIALRAHGLTTRMVAELISDIRAVIELNAAERGHEREVAGALDDLLRRLYFPNRAAVSSGSALGVKGAALRLRGPLRVLRSPAEHTAAEFVTAARQVCDVVDCCSEGLLRGGSLRHELRPMLHDQLLAILGDGEQVAA